MSMPFNGLSNWKLAHVAKSCNGVPAACPAWRPACQGHPQPGTTRRLDAARQGASPSRRNGGQNLFPSVLVRL